MIVEKSKMPNRSIEIDLTGEQGNAFYLLGKAKRLSNQLNLDTRVVLDRMRESDYENLVQVFDEYFGEYVTLLR